MKFAAYIRELFIILVVVACLTSADEVDDEREFSYEEDSEFGPAHWGEIRPEWATCNSGKMQSPINLEHKKVEIVSDLGPISTTYKPSSATLVNRGHDIMLSWPSGAGYVRINGSYGTRYQLKQCHWHSPSEHTINGKRLDLELHLVHQTTSNRTAVISILYKIGNPDSFLSKMIYNLKAVVDTQDVEKNVGIIDPKLIKFDRKSYYRYMGSLTTPPCTENVTWTIVREVRTVSREQVQLIRDAVHDDLEANARPVQPINGRIVKLYKPAAIETFESYSVDYLEQVATY